MMRLIFALPLIILCAASVFSQDRPQAFVGAEIIPISGPAISNGVLVVHRGRISATAADKKPERNLRLDTLGRVIKREIPCQIVSQEVR